MDLRPWCGRAALVATLGAAEGLWHYCIVMARVTFSLDEATVARIRHTAARLGKAQSQIVREAVAEYAERAGRLSDQERAHALGVLARLRAAAPSRPAADVDRELRAIRDARRAGGRRHEPA
jgi:hypothetical protein